MSPKRRFLAPGPWPPARRSGFTLVELLVVIVIIIILMGLLTPVLINALAAARQARIITELTGIDSAFKAYKERYGSYPPSDFSNLNTNGPVAIHLQRAFPRCNVQTELNAIATVTGSAGTLSPAQAICFWLSGFSPNVEQPISGKLTNPPPAVTYLFAFNPTQLIQVPGSSVPVYVPADGLGAPYVYFAAQNYLNSSGNGWALAYPTGVAAWSSQGGQGVCLPYLADNTPATSGQVNFVNPNSFQVISAGLDGNYGQPQSAGPYSYPSGTTANGPTGVQPYLNASNGLNFAADNLTNFSSKSLGDSVPQ